MYDLVSELSMYKLYSSKLSAEVIQEELEVLISNHNILSVNLSIVNLDKISITNNMVLNKIFFEFIMYLIYIDEITSDMEELYDDYIRSNEVYNELKDFYKIIPEKHRQVCELVGIFGNSLQFVGWMEGRASNLSCDAVFLTGYEDEFNG